MVSNKLEIAIVEAYRCGFEEGAAHKDELMDALDDCLEQLERDDQHINAMGKWKTYYAKARAAIAKARGETK